MTYGWAILIIAVVLGALFQLGIFNSATFTPKAPPGACHVFRPNGPGTTSFINTQGICNGELPQYVAKFNGAGSITVQSNNQITNYKNKITYVIWFNPSISSSTMSDTGFMSQVTGNNEYIDFLLHAGYLRYEVVNFSDIANQGGSFLTISPVSAGSWYQAALTYDGATLTGYLNGVFQASRTLNTNMPTNTNPLLLGYYVNYFKGSLVNAQIYNSTLSANEITALYNGGIGAAPIKLSNLVGWWPLNGDVKDYSGNNNNGVPTTGVTFMSNWESGYSAP